MIKKHLRLAANSLLAHRGLEIVHHRLESAPTEQLMLALRHFGIDLIVDVGANAGQYASELFEAGFEGVIESIEPLPDAHAALVAHARLQPRWKVLDRMALGAESGEVELHVAGNSLSSSVLPILDRHVDAAPTSKTVGSVKAPLRTLDDVALDRIDGARAVMLKIDTQGYEDAVLRGAARSLQRLTLVQLELSLQPLYGQQRLWLDMIGDMQARGFIVWSIQPEFCDPVTGQLLQVNGLFARA